MDIHSTTLLACVEVGLELRLELDDIVDNLLLSAPNRMAPQSAKHAKVAFTENTKKEQRKVEHQPCDIISLHASPQPCELVVFM